MCSKEPLAVRWAPNGDDIGHLRIRIEDCRGSLRLSNCQSASCGEQTKNVTQQLVTNIWHRVILFWQPKKNIWGEQRKTQMWTHMARMGLPD
jgi:hypothetical protein